MKNLNKMNLLIGNLSEGNVDSTVKIFYSK